MSHIGKDISFSFCVSYKILSQNFSFAQCFHCIKFSWIFVSYKIDISKTSRSQFFQRKKMFLAIWTSQKLIFNSFNILDCWNSWRCISIDLFLLIPLEISVVGSIFLSLLLVLICKFIWASFLRFLNSSCQFTIFLSRALSSLVSFF